MPGLSCISRLEYPHILLIALLAAQYVCQDIPTIIISDELELRHNLKKFKKNGYLSTAKSTDNILSDLRMALEALPRHLAYQEEILLVILNTEYVYIATGFQTDFKKGTLKLLQESIKLDGISSNLKATHEGIAPYKYINNKRNSNLRGNTLIYARFEI